MEAVAVSSDGVPVHFDVEGTAAQALVFVHGWSCDRRYWRCQMPYFAQRYRVLAVDLAGHGASGAHREAWTMAAFANDVVAAIDELELESSVLIGHSMGGDVIVEAALRLGGRVKGLVWVDTYRTLGDPLEPAETEAFADPFRRDFVGATRDFVRDLFLPASDPDLVEWVAGDMSAAREEIALDAMQRSITNQHAILATLPNLAAPIVAINP